MITLTEAQIADITYTKDGGEKSSRVIIPTYVPNNTNIRAIDVTELSDADRQQMARLVAEYKAYKEHAMKMLFTFESWVDHTYHASVDPKWRSFKANSIS